MWGKDSKSKVAGLFSPSPTWRPAKMTRQGPAKDTPPITWPGDRERGATRHFSKYSLIKGYFKRPILQNISAKLAPSVLKCQSLPISFLRAVRRENVSYIVPIEPIKDPPKRPAILSLLHYILQATSLQKVVNNKNRAGHSSTRGTVSSLLFFPLKVLLHTVYIFNIFMCTEVMDSRLL